MQRRPATPRRSLIFGSVANWIGKRTHGGTRPRFARSFRYRNGAFSDGKAASLPSMATWKNLATDLIDRRMIAQRRSTSAKVEVLDEGGGPFLHNARNFIRGSLTGARTVCSGER